MNKEKTYHREDLRRDLLSAGREYVAQNGHQSLSVRTLAQTVGVSPGAPYHHFRDRRALLLALALDGYAELELEAKKLMTEIKTPEQSLIDMGTSYIAFATSRPRLLDLMYESELTTPRTDPALLEHQFTLRANLVATLRAALPHCTNEELSMRVLALWSTIYGFASLRKRQVIEAFEPPEIDKDEIARFTVTFAVHAALRG